MKNMDFSMCVHGARMDKCVQGCAYPDTAPEPQQDRDARNQLIEYITGQWWAFYRSQPHNAFISVLADAIIAAYEVRRR